MALVRWNPMALATPRDFARMQGELDRLFDSVFAGRPLNDDATSAFAPAADIEETSEAFVIRLDLPGVSQKDVKVSLLGDALTIRGERRAQETQKGANLHRTERFYGSFERSFRLGTEVRSDQVQATYKDGVLEIRIPKAEQAKVREIEVRTA